MDLHSLIDDLDCFNTILIELTDKLHTLNIPIPSWQRYFEVLIVKFTMHSASLIHLFRGIPISMNSNRIHVYDIGSIYLLARAQIESYLMFYYLNIQPKSESEGLFRLYQYELSGLLQRQSYIVSDRYADKRSKEDDQIKHLITKLQATDFYKTLSIKEQSKYTGKKVNSKLMGWELLIKESPLKTDNFVQSWRLFSNYAHSEMIGSIQIKEYFKDLNQINDTIFATSRQVLMLICVAILDMISLSNDSRINLKNYSFEIQTKIDFWFNIARE